jgi:hypothetical protein
MGKTVKHPKRFIVSCRIDDREMRTLQELSRRSGVRISDLLRQTLLRLENV